MSSSTRCGVALALAAGAIVASCARPMHVVNRVPAFSHPRVTRVATASSAPPITPASASPPGQPIWHPVDARLVPSAFGVRTAHDDQGNVSIASDWFTSEIAVETRVDGGIVFVTVDGLVSVASTYLGTPRPLGVVPSSRQEQSASVGRAVVLDATRGLWTTDGVAPVARVENLPTASVRDAVFSSRDHGVAVLPDGAAWQTIDGGAHWREVDLQGDRVTELSIADGGIAMLTGAGWQLLSANGTRTAVAEPARVDPLLENDRWSADRTPFEAYARGLGQTLIDGPDRVIFHSSMGGDIHLLDVRTGAILSHAVVGGEGIARWGAALAVIHEYRSGARMVRHAADRPDEVFTMHGDSDPESEDETGHVVSEARFAAAREVITSSVLSTDGTHAVAAGTACTRADAFALCALMPTRDDHDRWVTIRIGERAAAAYAMRGTQVLVGIGPRGHGASLRVVDVATRRVQRIELPRGNAAIQSAAWLPDGQIAVRASPDEMLVGPVTGPLRAIRLPAGTRRAAFVDDRSGFAAGLDAAHIWRTRDGGVTFEPVLVAMHGDPASVQLNDSLQCDERLCVIGGAVVASADGPIPGVDYSVLSANRATVAPPANDPATVRSGIVDYSCRSRPRLRHVDLDGGPDESHLTGRGATASLTFSSEPDGTTHAHLRWAGTDARGDFALNVDAPIPASPVERPSQRMRHALLLATREGALLSRCSGERSRNDTLCNTLWVTPDGNAVSIEVGRQAVVAIARPGGGAAVLIGRDQAPSIAIAFDGAGQRIARVTTVGAEGIARSAGEVGVVTIDAETAGAARFVPLRADTVPMTFSWRGNDAARICGDEPHADVIEIRRSTWRDGLWMTGSRFVDGTMDELIEVSNGHACVRSLDATGWWNLSPGYGAAAADDDERGSGSVHLEARGGRLVGSMVARRRAAITCSLPRVR